MRLTILWGVPVLALTLLTFISEGAAECPEDQQRLVTIKSPPMENKGVATQELSSINLGTENVHLPNRRLRIRTITIHPGGHVKFHKHEDRPALAMITQGEVIEHTNHCQVPVIHKNGDIIQEVKGVEHWVENKTNEDAILTVSDIVNDAGDSKGNFK